MRERDAVVGQWLRDEVIAGHQEYLADPSQGVPAKEVLGRIKARRAELATAGTSPRHLYPKAETG
jgi:antitoxin ParD1/3/4